MSIPTSSKDKLLGSIPEFNRDGDNFYFTKDELLALLAQSDPQARIQAASDIFNLAHEYAQEDKTMHGAEELRDYHYFNAIAKIGEFDGR